MAIQFLLYTPLNFVEKTMFVNDFALFQQGKKERNKMIIHDKIENKENIHLYMDGRRWKGS